MVAHDRAGRGEFIRLCLEQASVPYIDVGKEEDGLNVVAKNKNMVKDGCAHFAPPILELPGGKTLSQTPVICTYIAEQHGLMPDGDVAKFSAMQLTQTIHDMVAEVRCIRLIHTVFFLLKECYTCVYQMYIYIYT